MKKGHGTEEIMIKLEVEKHIISFNFLLLNKELGVGAWLLPGSKVEMSKKVGGRHEILSFHGTYS